MTRDAVLGRITTSRVPACYTRLKPFAEWFASGWPVLTYHKVGPRPGRVRLRGLYMPPRLFRRQLQELAAAGFKTAPLDKSPPVAAPGPRTIAVTLDDGFENVFFHALPALVDAGFCGTLFLVSHRLGVWNDWEITAGERPERLMDAVQIREWIAAGQEIGAHSCTHPWLTRIPLARAREEIRASKQRLEDEFGVPVRHFCYPYGDFNCAVADLVLEAGYLTACTTQTGLNTSSTPALELRRITARYQSLSWRELKRWASRIAFSLRG